MVVESLNYLEFLLCLICYQLDLQLFAPILNTLVMNDNLRFILDKALANQKDSSKRLVKNFFLQILTIILAFGITNNISIIANNDFIKKTLFIEDPKIIIYLIPFFLTFLFIEFGYLLSYFKACRNVVIKLTDEILISESKTEDIGNDVRISFREMNFFDPMIMQFESKKVFSYFNILPVLSYLTIIGFNNYFIVLCLYRIINNPIYFIIVDVLLLIFFMSLYVHFISSHFITKSKTYFDSKSIEKYLHILMLLLLAYNFLKLIFI